MSLQSKVHANFRNNVIKSTEPPNPSLDETAISVIRRPDYLLQQNLPTRFSESIGGFPFAFPGYGVNLFNQTDSAFA